MSKSLSVVIPTYNGVEFIQESLAAVFAQSLPPAELILVDDASTDETLRIVEEEAAHAPVPVRVIRLTKNSGGPAEPLAVGVLAASSELVAVCEQDDVMLPQKCERAVACFDLCDTLTMAISRYEVISDKTGKVRIRDDSFSGFDHIGKRHLKSCFYAFEGPSVYECALQRNFAVSLSNMVFRRSAFVQLPIERELRRALDHALLLLHAREGQIGFIDERLWSFTRHAKSAAACAPWEMWWEDYRMILECELRSVQDPRQSRMLQPLLRKHLNAGGWQLRQQGDFSLAWGTYYASLMRTGLSIQAIVGLFKTTVYQMFRRAQPIRDTHHPHETH